MSMRLFLSYEDHAALGDERYRSQVTGFLERHPDVRSNGHIVEEEFGCTVFDDGDWSDRMLDKRNSPRAEEMKICWQPERNTDGIWKLRYDSKKADQIGSRLQSSPLPWRRDWVPVFVLDSDGIDPESLLEYIEGVVYRSNGRRDSIRMGHVSRILSLIGSGVRQPPSFGKFGIVVQNPNLEGGRFDGYERTLTSTDSVRSLLARILKLAFIARPRYSPVKPTRLNSKTMGPFIENGGRELLRDGILDLDSSDQMYENMPAPLVSYVDGLPGEGFKSLMCSSYFSKKGTRGERLVEMGTSFRQLGIRQGRTSFSDDDFTFRMFDTSRDS